ncbi:MAG: putative transrane anti-sigma factor [Variovorax sp.]|nr:putative transrane anti-sigma factor [Variovorax sp.]
MQTPEDDALGTLIRREATRHAAPAGLAGRILHDVRAVAVAASVPANGTHPATRSRWRRWLEAASLFGAGAATAWGLALSLLVTSPQALTLDAVAAGHVRSLMGSHLTDVASSDRHTVKPWFAGRIDFSPPVVDLAAQGFPLTGGRLDYLDNRAVAALVYRSGPHTVNLFVWPAAGRQDEMPTLATRQGYNIVHWRQAGMQAWAASDLNAAELQRFAGLVRERTGAPDAGP